MASPTLSWGHRAKPQYEKSVEVSDERSGALDGLTLAGGRVTEPKVLLELAEADLDAPACRIGLDDIGDVEFGVGAEKHTYRQVATEDPDKHDSQVALVGDPIPLSVEDLDLEGRVLAVDMDGGLRPSLAWGLGQLGWCRQALSSFATAPRWPLLLWERQRRERGIGPHRTDEHDIRRQLTKDRRDGIGRIRCDSHSTARCPLRHDKQHFVGELSLGLERRVTSLARGLGPIQPEQQRQRPRATRKRQSDTDRNHDPDVTEGKHFPGTARADWIDVRAEPEDLRTLVRDQSVVDDDSDLIDVCKVLDELGEEQTAELVGRPRTAGKESMQSLVMNAPLDTELDQRLRDRVRAAGEDPAAKHQHSVGEAGFGEGRCEDFGPGQECVRTSEGHRDEGPPGRLLPSVTAPCGSALLPVRRPRNSIAIAQVTCENSGGNKGETRV